MCDIDKGTDLSMENSMALKFLQDIEARVRVTLTSTSYCVSPLVQVGLEIPCRVEISMPPTKKNKNIMDIYKDITDLHSDEREEISKVGSF